MTFKSDPIYCVLPKGVAIGAQDEYACFCPSCRLGWHKIADENAKDLIGDTVKSENSWRRPVGTFLYLN